MRHVQKYKYDDNSAHCLARSDVKLTKGAKYITWKKLS